MGSGVLLSQRAYAKRIGRSKSWVNNLVKDGVIELKGPKRKIDPIQADVAISSMKDPTRDAQREANERRRKEKTIFDDDVRPKESLADMTPEERMKFDEELSRERKRLEALKEEAEKRGVNIDAPVDIKGASLSKVKIFSELYRGKLNQLEYEKKRGEVIPASEVRQEAAELAMLIKGKAVSRAHIASVKISSALHLTDEDRVVVESILRDDANEFLEEMSTHLNKENYA